MRLRSLIPAAALLAVACSPAFADEIVTLSNASNAISFTVPSAPAGNSGAGGDFQLSDLPVDVNGAITDENVVFYDTASMGGLLIYNSSTYATLLQGYSTQLFGGTVSDPTFSPGGPYALTAPAGSGDITGAFSVEIANVPTSVTPEPSSFILLGTGLLGLAGMRRRRLA